MGGEYRSDLDSHVTHVLANDPRTEKCKVALEFSASGRQNIHVIMPSWVMRTWEEQELQDIDEHRIPCLGGLLVSCTGFGNVHTKELAKQVRLSGGDFSADLSSSCTHLIAKHREGDKYKFAQRKGIAIVSQEWLDECIKLCQVLPPDRFIMTTSSPTDATVVEDRPGVHALPADCVPDSVQSWAAEPPSFQQTGGTHFEGVKMAFASDVDEKLRKELVSACRAGGGSSVSQGAKLRSITHFVARGPTVLDTDAQALKASKPLSHIITTIYACMLSVTHQCAIF